MVRPFHAQRGELPHRLPVPRPVRDLLAQQLHRVRDLPHRAVSPNIAHLDVAPLFAGRLLLTVLPGKEERALAQDSVHAERSAAVQQRPVRAARDARLDVHGCLEVLLRHGRDGRRGRLQRVTPLEGLYGIAVRKVGGNPVGEDFPPLLVRERGVEEWVPRVVRGIRMPEETGRWV